MILQLQGCHIYSGAAIIGVPLLSCMQSTHNGAGVQRPEARQVEHREGSVERLRAHWVVNEIQHSQIGGGLQLEQFPRACDTVTTGVELTQSREVLGA